MTKAQMLRNLKRYTKPDFFLVDFDKNFLKMKKKDCYEYYENFICTESYLYRRKREFKKLSNEQFARLYLRLMNKFVKCEDVIEKLKIKTKKEYLIKARFNFMNRRLHQKYHSKNLKNLTTFQAVETMRKVCYFKNIIVKTKI